MYVVVAIFFRMKNKVKKADIKITIRWILTTDQHTHGEKMERKDARSMEEKWLLCVFMSSYDIPDTWANGDTLELLSTGATSRIPLENEKEWKLMRYRKQANEQAGKRIPAVVFALSKNIKSLLSNSKFLFRLMAFRAAYGYVCGHSATHTELNIFDIRLPF